MSPHKIVTFTLQSSPLFLNSLENKQIKFRLKKKKIINDMVLTVLY